MQLRIDGVWVYYKNFVNRLKKTKKINHVKAIFHNNNKLHDGCFNFSAVVSEIQSALDGLGGDERFW